ncbi:hypothetical protein ABPG74_020183 [Tetrahymena malaccensis]
MDYFQKIQNQADITFTTSLDFSKPELRTLENINIILLNSLFSEFVDDIELCCISCDLQYCKNLRNLCIAIDSEDVSPLGISILFATLKKCLNIRVLHLDFSYTKFDDVWAQLLCQSLLNIKKIQDLQIILNSIKISPQCATNLTSCIAQLNDLNNLKLSFHRSSFNRLTEKTFQFNENLLNLELFLRQFYLINSNYLIVILYYNVAIKF